MEIPEKLQKQSKLARHITRWCSGYGRIEDVPIGEASKLAELVLAEQGKVLELLGAADEVWTEAAEGGSNVQAALISSHLIRRLALAVSDITGTGREYAEQWSAEEE